MRYLKTYETLNVNISKLDPFYVKLTDNILKSKSFKILQDFLEDNLNKALKLMFSCTDIESITNVDINSNEILSEIFNFESTGRGNTKGKGELLILFLVKDSKFSNHPSLGDIEINNNFYQVKAYPKNAPITFGVENTFTRFKFGDRLYKLISAVYEAGENDEDFREKFSWWFEIMEKKNTWYGTYRVFKMRGFEISSEEFIELPEQIEDLKGYINHPYVNNINEYENDMQDLINKFKNRLTKIALFTKGKLYSTNANYHLYGVTQARIKMKLY